MKLEAEVSSLRESLEDAADAARSDLEGLLKHACQKTTRQDLQQTLDWLRGIVRGWEPTFMDGS